MRFYVTTLRTWSLPMNGFFRPEAVIGYQQ